MSKSAGRNFQIRKVKDGQLKMSIFKLTRLTDENHQACIKWELIS